MQNFTPPCEVGWSPGCIYHWK